MTQISLQSAHGDSAEPTVDTDGFSGIVGRSSKMMRVFDLIRLVSRTTATVLLLGETGTGKELVAEALHRLGPNRDGRFVTLNCAALPETLLESELFGVRRGAYTGALANRRGLFEEASQGTLFLDEIGNMSVPFQVKLLRVLQQNEVTQLGTTVPTRVAPRIVAATNADLAAAVRKGSFREDLYYRLNVVEIHLPPLRERGDDVLLLASYFLKRYSAKYDLKRTFAYEALAALEAHRWPGNVRELENIVERAVVVARGQKIVPGDLAFRSKARRGVSADEDLYELPYEEAKSRALALFQERYVRRVLELTGGNITRAAKIAGVTRAGLRRILKKNSIGLPSSDTAPADE